MKRALCSVLAWGCPKAIEPSLLAPLSLARGHISMTPRKLPHFLQEKPGAEPTWHLLLPPSPAGYVTCLTLAGRKAGHHLTPPIMPLSSLVLPPAAAPRSHRAGPTPESTLGKWLPPACHAPPLDPACEPRIPWALTPHHPAEQGASRVYAESSLSRGSGTRETSPCEFISYLVNEQVSVWSIELWRDQHMSLHPSPVKQGHPWTSKLPKAAFCTTPNL